MVIWIIICVLGCIAAGWQMFVTFHEEESRKTKITSAVLCASTVLLLIVSIMAFKQHLIKTIVLENYHVEQVIKSDTIYTIKYIYENPR